MSDIEITVTSLPMENRRVGESNCWKCGGVINLGDADGQTYLTNPPKYAHAAGKCRTPETNNKSVAERQLEVAMETCEADNEPDK